MTSLIDLERSGLTPRRGARIMLWVIAGFFIVALLWAALADLDTVTRGQGRVVPSRQLQRVAHLEGGVLAEINTRQGARVRKGDLLLTLDPTQAQAELARTAAGESALSSRLGRLDAEIFPGSATGASGAELDLYNARRQELSTDIGIARAKFDGARRGYAAAAAELAARAEARRFAEQELATVGPLADKGIAPAAEKSRAQSEVAQARANEAAASAALGRAAAAVSEARADGASVSAKFRSAAGVERAQARAEVQGLRAALPALRDRMNRTVIRAPVDGIVNRVLVNTVGSAVRAGEPLVEIVPLDDTLVIETRIRPRDIGFIRPNQPAKIKLTAYDSSIYGDLTGWVEGIGADAIADEASKETFYMIRVRTRGTLKDRAGRPLQVVPGMTAEVDLIGARRSVLSYLLTPFQRMREDAFRER